MVRTRAENTGRRAVAAKAPRKQLGGGSSSSSILGSPGSKDKNSGGNPVRWAPTPSWQKGIGNFFSKSDSSIGENSCGPNDDTTPSTTNNSSSLQEPSSEITSLDE